jgi:hypothetical protein
MTGSVRRCATVKHSVKHVRRSMSSAEFVAIRRRTHNGEERQMALFMDVHNVHRQAHGLIADEIYPVTEHA